MSHGDKLLQVFVYDEASFKYLKTQFDHAATKQSDGSMAVTFADLVTHITPFTNWNISLPPTKTNVGLELDDLLVDIEIDFHITAIYNDPVESLRAAML